ncbi:TRAP-type C4-dicarboxylate transport system, substrate-binding protein [Paracoccus isoporae]|uniref:TRAP-type C4-dicarboxylate transport system, substrate-binding protein n=1 Tax=Paracoccus isoporae TaxID=591205 RepID=A0A1G6V6M5_9RHOB|nr:TRAP transporter substrate-binding protein [Paracoccus isoporae]SDD49084.1 TRAP-type C4-dicarboxylate transport system, substrate-binding protein [Paracoccus isoporae]
MKTTIISGAVALTAALPAAAETTLSLSHYLPAVHGIHTDFIEPWTQQVSECSGGEVSFEIFPGGTQKGNVAKQQEQVMAGVVDIAHGLSGIPRGRFNRTSLIEMPFLTRDAGAASNALWSLYEEGELGDEYDGLKVLALHAHNGGLLHTNGTHVETMEDMKGLRIRTPSPPVSEMLTFLGATPQGLPPGEVYENIQRKVIDGTVFPWDPVKSFGLNEVLTDHLDIGAYTVSFFFVMNQDKFDSLPENVQNCIDEASGAELVGKFGDWWDAWDAAGREEAEAAGHTITALSDEERDRWREALTPMIDKYLETMQSEGVEDAAELYQKFQDRIAEFESGQ